MEEFGRDCCIRSYHVRIIYKEMWEAASGEVLECWESCTIFKVDMPWLKKKKNRNNHGTNTTKVVKSVFILLVMRGTISCTVTGGEDTLYRSVHRIELTFVYCAQKCTLFSYRKLSLF